MCIRDRTRFVTDAHVLLPVLDTAGCCEPFAQALIDEEQAGNLASLLKAIADPARLRLLSLVAAEASGESCVCDLTEPLALSQPTVSYHLKNCLLYTSDAADDLPCAA